MNYNINVYDEARDEIWTGEHHYMRYKYNTFKVLRSQNLRQTESKYKTVSKAFEWMNSSGRKFSLKIDES